MKLSNIPCQICTIDYRNGDVPFHFATIQTFLGIISSIHFESEIEGQKVVK